MAWHHIGAKPFYFHFNRTKKQTYFNGQGAADIFGWCGLDNQVHPGWPALEGLFTG